MQDSVDFLDTLHNYFTTAILTDAHCQFHVTIVNFEILLFDMNHFMQKQHFATFVTFEKKCFLWNINFLRVKKHASKHLTRWRFFRGKHDACAPPVCFIHVLFCRKEGCWGLFLQESRRSRIFATQQTDRYSSVCVFCETLVFCKATVKTYAC